MKRPLALLIVLSSVGAVSLMLLHSTDSQVDGVRAAPHERVGSSVSTETGNKETKASGDLANLATPEPTGHPSRYRPTPTIDTNSEFSTSPVLIDALYYDGHAVYDYDEAFRLINLSVGVIDLGGWSVTDDPGRTGAIFPAGTSLAPGEAIWCTRKATDFEEQFGFTADYETDDTDPAVPELNGSWPTFANTGGACLLRDASDQPLDALVYAGGASGIPGWDGPPLEPWSPSNYFGAEGQILYRKRDEITGLPVADTGTAADWAQDPDDPVHGRKVQYPGWDLDQFFWTPQLAETAVLTVAVGPDHLLETVRAQIEKAQESIQIETYTFESVALAQALIERMAAGVSVTVLLEGSPAGGIDPAQRWICGQIAAAGGQVYFMQRGTTPTRYRFQHAKVILIDDRLVLIGTENLNPSAMPADDKGDGTAGRRGIYLITDAPSVVSHVQALLAVDIDPVHHGDLVTCADLPELCIGAEPLPEPQWTSYTVAFASPLTAQGHFFELIQSPENSLRTVDSLLGLVGQAGSGDTLLIEQSYEHLQWGPADGDPESDPNLRLVAYLDAARRSARVRILLNSLAFGEYLNENVETAAYLRSVAQSEGLDLQVRLGNPTHLGVHNKMVLAQIKGQGHLHVGSINGSEVSSKVNREVALQVQSDAAYDYLRTVFEYDWYHSPLVTYLPVVARNHQVPMPADHLLISELFYAVSKEQEWLEIVNPTGAAVDLSVYQIGDAERPDSFEGMYRFPLGASLGSRHALVVAASAAAFRQAYGHSPDYELYETDLSVPNLTPAAAWGTGEWELRNAGDEVLILDELNHPVDVVVYGDDAYPGIIGHPGVSLYTHSLERYPALFDTDDCSLDLRDWPFPNPGTFPYP